jgi:hypothetical protein
MFGNLCYIVAVIFFVGENREPGEKQTPAAKHLQTLSHNVVSSTPRLSRNRFIFVEKERLSEKFTELFQINGEGSEKSNDKEAEHSLLEVENLQEISESEVAVITRNLISKQGKTTWGLFIQTVRESIKPSFVPFVSFSDTKTESLVSLIIICVL